MCWCPHADEDFGGDVEIPEDVQAQLLEDYERECEETSKKNSSKGSIQCDKTQSQCPTDKEAQTSTKNNADPKQTKLNTDVELLQELKVDLSKAAETSSKPSPSSTGKCLHEMLMLFP